MFNILMVEGVNMKNAIWEYLELSEKEKEELWKNAIFVFDANVLLNLYRYSAKTRDALFLALKSLNGKLWIPHQVAYEYAKNRCDVIYEMVAKYDTLATNSDDFVKQFYESLRLKDSDAEIMALKNSIFDWLNLQKKSNLQVTNPSDDDILRKLLELFDGRVGEKFTDLKIKEIEESGKERYEKFIPPGYCDSVKVSGNVSNNAYGDLMVWKQIIEYSKTYKRNIIFVTHDQKEDWWNKAKGKTVGPRIELRKEFQETTGQKFHMYSMDSFIKRCSDLSDKPTDQSVIDEVSRINNTRIYQNRNRLRHSNDDIMQMDKEVLMSEFYSVEDELIETYENIEKRKMFVAQLEESYNDKDIPEDINNKIYNSKRNIDVLNRKQDILLRRYAELESFVNNNKNLNEVKKGQIVFS